jgi:hypothetical protein
VRHSAELAINKFPMNHILKSIFICRGNQQSQIYFNKSDLNSGVYAITHSLRGTVQHQSIPYISCAAETKQHAFCEQIATQLVGRIESCDEVNTHQILGEFNKSKTTFYINPEFIWSTLMYSWTDRDRSFQI